MKWDNLPQINSTYSEIFFEFASFKICVSFERASFVIDSFNSFFDAPSRHERNFLSDSWHFNIKKWVLFIWWEQNVQIFCGKLSSDEIFLKNELNYFKNTFENFQQKFKQKILQKWQLLIQICLKILHPS